MANTPADQDLAPGADGRTPERKTVAASDLGLSLTIRPEVLEEFDRIQEEATKAAEEVQRFSWR